jgi:hypothetical protein
VRPSHHGNSSIDTADHSNSTAGPPVPLKAEGCFRDCSHWVGQGKFMEISTGGAEHGYFDCYYALYVLGLEVPKGEHSELSLKFYAN